MRSSSDTVPQALYVVGTRIHQNRSLRLRYRRLLLFEFTGCPRQPGGMKLGKNRGLSPITLPITLFAGTNGSNSGFHACLPVLGVQGMPWYPGVLRESPRSDCGFNHASAPPAPCDPRTAPPASTPIPATGAETTICRDARERSDRPGNGRRDR
jgi:hypothetical protein